MILPISIIRLVFVLLCLIVLPASRATVVERDLCIYGGTSAGVIAAVQAAKEGRTVVLVEPGQHLGGMSVEGLGGTDIDNHKEFQNSPAVGGLALEFYRRISQRYGRLQQFDEMIRARAEEIPLWRFESGLVEAKFQERIRIREKQSALWRFEPHVAEAVFDDWVREAGVKVLRGHRLKEKGGVKKRGARIVSLRFENGAEVRAKMFIDATYEGDLMAFAGVSFSVGREGNAKYAETKNGIRTDTKHGQLDKRVDAYKVPGDPKSGVLFGVQDVPTGRQGEPDESIQGYCFRLCLTKNPTNRVSIEKPGGYDPAHYELQRRYIQAGGVISAPGASIPNGKTDPGSWHSLAGNFTGWNHTYPIASYAERERMLRESRDYIQGVYWFMANDPVVPEKQRAEWASWGRAKDEFTDNDNWPRAFYVRNGRRMVSDFVLTEAHVRKANPAPVEDSVGLIWWPPDLHHARRIVKEGRVWNEGAVFDESKDADWIPCGIPYRSLVPRASECTNLLSPTCPSSSYVAYGAYRIEFTFMIAAQSAASAACQAMADNVPVQKVSYPKLRERLLKDGQVLAEPNGAKP